MTGPTEDSGAAAAGPTAVLGTDGASAAEKHDALRALLGSYGSVLVAYSGGVDSALLLKVAVDVLGPRATAFTARSPSLPERDLAEASALARSLGARHVVVESNEHLRPGYVANAPDRCYHCKSELFDLTAARAASEGGAVVVDGYNADDRRDFRPGHRAAEEHGVRHPLAEVGLTKAEIRELSRALRLPTWDKPQAACLSSRIPYGTEVTLARLSRVGATEEHLKALGFRQVRARLVSGSEDTVRIEVGEDELARALQMRREIAAGARAAGFTYVTLDLEGFRSGSMNAVLRR